MRSSTLARWQSPLARRLIVAIVLFSAASTLVLTSIQIYGQYRQEINAIEAGLRFKPITTLEMIATAGYFDADGSDTNFGYSIGGLFDLADNVKLGLTYGDRLDTEYNRVYVQVSF